MCAAFGVEIQRATLVQFDPSCRHFLDDHNHISYLQLSLPALQEYGISAATSDSDSVTYTCSINCPESPSVNKTPLIVGLVVGLGGGLILIAILATMLIRRHLSIRARAKYLVPSASVVRDLQQYGVTADVGIEVQAEELGINIHSGETKTTAEEVRTGVPPGVREVLATAVSIEVHVEEDVVVEHPAHADDVSSRHGVDIEDEKAAVEIQAQLGGVDSGDTTRESVTSRKL